MGACEEVARPSLLEARPFEWSPQEPSEFEFEMVNGIIRIFQGSQRETEAFPVPGSSYDFFSDMHWWAVRPLLLMMCLHKSTSVILVNSWHATANCLVLNIWLRLCGLFLPALTREGLFS